MPAFQCKILLELLCFPGIRIQHRYHLNATHHLTLRHEPACYAACANDAHPINGLRSFTQHGRGYTLRARQINHLTILVQIVEVPHPVAADGKDVYVILLYVIYLLSYVVFNHNLVGITSCLHCFHALQHVVAHIQFATLTVEAVTSDTNYQIVAQLFCPPQQIDMPLVQQVVGTVCNYFLHSLFLLQPFIFYITV